MIQFNLESIEYDDNGPGLSEQIESLTAPPSFGHSQQSTSSYCLPTHHVLKSRQECARCRYPGYMLVCQRCPASFHPTCLEPPVLDRERLDNFVPIKFQCDRCNKLPELDDYALLPPKARKKKPNTSGSDSECQSVRSLIDESQTSPLKVTKSGRISKENQSVKEQRKRIENIKKFNTKPERRQLTAYNEDERNDLAMQVIVKRRKDVLLYKGKKFLPEKFPLLCMEIANVQNPTEFSLPFEPRPKDTILPGDDRSHSSLQARRAYWQELAENRNGEIPRVPLHLCNRCQRTCAFGQMTRCDYCDQIYHLECLNDLSAYRKGRSWRCPLHAEAFIDRIIHCNKSLTNQIDAYDKLNDTISDQTSVIKTFFQLLQNQQTRPPGQMNVIPDLFAHSFNIKKDEPTTVERVNSPLEVEQSLICGNQNQNNEYTKHDIFMEQLLADLRKMRKASPIGTCFVNGKSVSPAQSLELQTFRPISSEDQFNESTSDTVLSSSEKHGNTARRKQRLEPDQEANIIIQYHDIKSSISRDNTQSNMSFKDIEYSKIYGHCSSEAEPLQTALPSIEPLVNGLIVENSHRTPTRHIETNFRRPTQKKSKRGRPKKTALIFEQLQKVEEQLDESDIALRLEKGDNRDPLADFYNMHYFDTVRQIVCKGQPHAYIIGFTGECAVFYGLVNRITYFGDAHALNHIYGSTGHIDYHVDGINRLLPVSHFFSISMPCEHRNMNAYELHSHVGSDVVAGSSVESNNLHIETALKFEELCSVIFANNEYSSLPSGAPVIGFDLLNEADITKLLRNACGRMPSMFAIRFSNEMLSGKKRLPANGFIARKPLIRFAKETQHSYQLRNGAQFFLQNQKFIFICNNR